jgi:hypothetical protein
MLLGQPMRLLASIFPQCAHCKRWTDKNPKIADSPEIALRHNSD